VSDYDFAQLLERLLEIRVELNKNSLLIEKVQTDVDIIKEEDKKQNQLLAEHIQGVHTNSERLTNEIKYRALEFKTLQETINALQERVERAEFVPDLFSRLKKAILWITPVLAGVLVLYNFWDTIFT